MNSWMIVYIVVALVLACIGGYYAYFFWMRRQNNHFARIFKFTPQGSPFRPSFTGIYRRYQVTIEPVLDPHKKNKHTLTSVSIRMQNPNKKGVFISKLDDKPFYNLGIEISEITPLGQFDPPLQGGTNDIMMAGIMMTEDVKRQIIARFGEIPRGMLYLWGEELGFLSPVFAGKTENYEIWAKQLDVLCDMKDTLQ